MGTKTTIAWDERAGKGTPPPPVGGGEGAICLRVGGIEPKEGLLSGVGEGLRC